MANLSCTLPLTEADISYSDYVSSAKLSSYPVIVIRRDTLSGSPGSMPTKYGVDHKILMTPANETLPKRLTRIYFEEGINEVLKDADERTVQYPIVNTIVKCLRFLTDKARQMNTLIWPYLHDRELNLIANYSQTRNWLSSPIRFMSWHPKVFKLAIATSDDNIRIYTNDSTNQTVLKNGYQKCITSLAWRPLCASELAVGVYSGVILWKLDPNSSTLRLTSQFSILKSGKHYPITSLNWNHTGTLLATASVADTDVVVWSIDTNRNVALKRIGPPCALLQWSPNSSRLCTSTVGSVFRVWETNKWTPERWILPTGAIQSIAWSPCSNHLLFVTTTESILYSLCFIDDQLYQTSIAPKQSFPIADLSRVQVGRQEFGGQPKSICWDPTGKYVAVMFCVSSSIAIFNTTIDRNLLSISPSCYVKSNASDESPSFICFQPIYEKNSNIVLTIGWSSGRVQYFPLC